MFLKFKLDFNLKIFFGGKTNLTHTIIIVICKKTFSQMYAKIIFLKDEVKKTFKSLNMKYKKTTYISEFSDTLKTENLIIII